MAEASVKSEYWLFWPDNWEPSPSDRPVVTHGRPAGDGRAVWIEIPRAPALRSAHAAMEELVGDPYAHDHGWGLRTEEERWATVNRLRAERREVS